jgi:hypothetical protein
MQAAGLGARGMSAVAAHSASLAIVSHEVQRQATTMAYNDAYLLVGITLALVFPAAFLFKKRNAKP